MPSTCTRRSPPSGCCTRARSRWGTAATNSTGSATPRWPISGLPHGPSGSARPTSRVWSMRSGGCAARASASLKCRVLALHPVPDPAAPVGPAQTLADDPLQTHFAGLGEDDRALSLDRLAEHDGVDPGDQRVQFRPADLQRQLAPVLAVDVQEIEDDHLGVVRAALGSERREVGVAIGTEHHGLAVEQDVVDGQGADRRGDPREPVGEVGCVPGPQRDPASLLAGEQPVAVMLYLVEPLRTRRRPGYERRLRGNDEPGRRTAPRTRRGGTPQHAQGYGAVSLDWESRWPSPTPAPAPARALPSCREHVA